MSGWLMSLSQVNIKGDVESQISEMIWKGYAIDTRPYSAHLNVTQVHHYACLRLTVFRQISATFNYGLLSPYNHVLMFILIT